MGLAASQARFLALTARKSNVEYQGQQINQARTALANEVMNLYQKYNKLDVPVPPSVNDYTKTIYTIDSTYEDYQITAFSKITSGPQAGYYNVSLTYDESLAKAYSYVAKNAVATVKKDDDGYSYINFTFGTDTYTYDKNDEENSTITKITGDYEKYAGLETVMKAQGKVDGTYYMYNKNGVNYFTSEDDLNSTAFVQYGDEYKYNGDYAFDYQGEMKTSKTINAVAALTQGKDGRLSTINVIECEDAPELENHTYSITTGTEDDQQAYEDAMNQYYYRKALYEKEVETINKETEKIQTEDKSLELKLSQLDTEQNAISTEMDSVSKVIEDTVEKVFKTFN